MNINIVYLEDILKCYTPEAKERMEALMYAADKAKPVEIDPMGLIWKDGKVFINTYRTTWDALMAGLIEDVIVKEKCGTEWIVWKRGSRLMAPDACGG